MSFDRSLLRRDLIKHEGFRSKPYKDSVGVTTIGVGWNLDANGLPERMLWELLELGIDNATGTLDGIWAQWRNLDDVRQRVLVNMAFNLGPRIGNFKKFLFALGQRDYKQAAKEMLDSTWARQVGPRAIELAKEMETGKDS